MLYEFSRTELLLGKDNMARLKSSVVAVFGVGGVGSFTVEGLVRAGVGKLVLIDNDSVCITNINRQILATQKTIGRPKVEVMKERLLEINPKAEVTIHQQFYGPETSKELLHQDYDYIVDAIDSVPSKVDLIATAKKMNIPIISCMGAGNKLDPTKFEVSDIYKTSVCPLARVMRKLLREKGVSSLKVVYSKEEPKTPLEADPSDVKQRVPGSISFVPSVAGLIIAGEVVKDLIR